MTIRPGVVFKAALLAKTDLTTELVKEFTELQGIVGGLYAKVQELDPILPKATAEAIGDAIYDQYKPESMDDEVPRSVEGAVLSIADKADSIAGMFALGLAAHRIERSVCAAPGGERHREDHRRAQAAAVHRQAVCRCARRVRRVGSGAAFRHESELRRSPSATSCASAWSSTCAMRVASPMTW